MIIDAGTKSSSVALENVQQPLWEHLMGVSLGFEQSDQ